MDLQDQLAKGTACIGCRLRRKRCDKKQPLCTGCSDLQIPRELCIYRKMGLASKDSKATLSKEIKKNRELKDDKERAAAIFKYNKKSTGSPQDYFYIKDPRKEGSYKQFQLNPEKNPLLCTVMTAPQTSAYLGSISVAAITEAEPQMKLLLQQIHRVIMKEKLVYEKRVVDGTSSTSDKEAVVNSFNEQGKTLMVGMGGINGDQSIIELIADIEQNFPPQHTCKYALDIFYRQNRDRWVLFPFTDKKSFKRKFDSIIQFNPSGKVHFNIDLLNEAEKLIFIAWVLSILSLASFCFGQAKNDLKQMDYVLFAKYSHALTRIDLVGEKIRMGPQAVGSDFILVNFNLLLLEKYTASAGFMDSLDQICEATLSIRLLITMAMSLNLNKDIEKYYPNATAGEKRSMKTLWYTLVLYETFESMDIGFISKYEPASFRRQDYCYNGMIETIHVVHSVIFNYNMVDDMGKVDDLIEFMENNLIGRLKTLLKDEFTPLTEDVIAFQQYDLDDLSEENLKDYSLILQRLALRYFIFAIILAFYHICYKRLEQVGEVGTKRCRKYRLLGWKYALTIETLFRDMWIGYNRIGNHKNYFDFYPVASLILMAPILRFAQRRVTLFAISRLLNMLNVDEHLVVQYVLYGNDHNDAAILKSLEDSGELSQIYTIADLDDYDIDDNDEELLKKFGKLNSVRFLVMSLSKVMSHTLSLMNTDQSTFNFLKLSKIFHVLLLRLCSFLLQYTVQDSDNSGPEDSNQMIQHNRTSGLESPPVVNTGSSSSDPRFDFKQFFATGQDITVNEDEIFELFDMTTRNRFTW